MDIKVIASGSSGNATFISDGVTALLLDAGIPMKNIQAGTGFRLSSVAGCLVTHEHGDHSKAIKDIAKRGIDVYASRGTLDEVGVSGHRFHAVARLEPITVGSFVVLPFDVKHDAADPLGYLLESTATGEKLIYFSDTAYVRYTFSGLTHIIAECNHGKQELRQSVASGAIEPGLAKRIAKNHFSAERLTDFLEANDLSRLKAVYLVHLSDNNSNAGRFRQAVQRKTGAEVYVP
ncbi:MAG: MBL fold metallo-hydrolase [Clostridium sp.]|jgi:phosphoribosyl 1,2-cyclic phosphodiesterase|nr:MBL fold metallo-hydrolase [Clostridium sp.]